MKKISLITLFVLSLFIFIGAGKADALPLLQLDIVDGFYIAGSEESTVTYSPVLTLQALARGETDSSDSTNGDKVITTGQTAYLSVAIETDPKGTNDMSYTGGSIDGAALTDWQYGNPFGNGNQKSHGIFQTLYTEIAFTFTADDFCTDCLWNAQDGSSTNFDGFIHEFSVDLTDVWAHLLSREIEAYHFDLYTKDAKGNIQYFAPFSHDAAATVPEPSTLLLLGSGLLGLAYAKRRKN